MPGSSRAKCTSLVVVWGGVWEEPPGSQRCQGDLRDWKCSKKETVFVWFTNSSWLQSTKTLMLNKPSTVHVRSTAGRQHWETLASFKWSIFFINSLTGGQEIGEDLLQAGYSWWWTEASRWLIETLIFTWPPCWWWRGGGQHLCWGRNYISLIVTSLALETFFYQFCI